MSELLTGAGSAANVLKSPDDNDRVITVPGAWMSKTNGVSLYSIA
jgi:hypothetical protein